MGLEESPRSVAAIAQPDDLVERQAIAAPVLHAADKAFVHPVIPGADQVVERHFVEPGSTHRGHVIQVDPMVARPEQLIEREVAIARGPQCADIDGVDPVVAGRHELRNRSEMVSEHPHAPYVAEAHAVLNHAAECFQSGGLEALLLEFVQEVEASVGLRELRLLGERRTPHTAALELAAKRGIELEREDAAATSILDHPAADERARLPPEPELDLARPA